MHPNGAGRNGSVRFLTVECGRPGRVSGAIDDPSLHALGSVGVLELSGTAVPPPDVVVMDCERERGLAGCVEDLARVRSLLRDVAVVVSCPGLDEGEARALIQLGASAVATRQPALPIAIMAAGAGVHAVSGDRPVAALPSLANGDVSTLSEREMEALRHVAEGLTNDEVALEMALSTSAVRLHLTSLFSKLGARNRTEAVVRAHRMRLISLD